MASPPLHDLAVSPCFHDFLPFLCKHFPPQSPPSRPLSSPLCSQQQLSFWDCSTIPTFQLPATGDLPSCPAYIWLQQGLSDSYSIQSVTDQLLHPSLKCFSSVPNTCPSVRIGPLLQFSHPPRAGPVLLTLLFYPLLPSSYRVFHGSMYTFPVVKYSCPLSAGVLQTLLCEGVFLMYLWRQMYSTSTYFSAILFNQISPYFDTYIFHVQFSSVHFSHLVMSASLTPRGLQLGRLPCPSPTPGAYSNSCPFELVMLSNHLILCCHLLLPPSLFPSVRVFSNESVLHIRWSKYQSFSFSISPSSEYSELISFRMDWLDLCCPRDSQESSPIPQFSTQFSLQTFLHVQYFQLILHSCLFLLFICYSCTYFSDDALLFYSLLLCIFHSEHFFWHAISSLIFSNSTSKNLMIFTVSSFSLSKIY